jgi:hypothetical protein
MKRRDKRLRNDEVAFTQTWQVVKESVRQLKHDYKRNNLWKNFQASRTNINIPSPSTANSNVVSTEAIACHDDENNIREVAN